MPLTALDIRNLETVAARISGSVGDRTWSRNAHGPFHRDRVTPANPQTLEQQFYRARFRDLSRRWADTLTEAQRDGWRAYGANRHHRSRGPEIQLSGFNEYTRHNFRRRRYAAPLVDNAPTIFSGVEVTKMSVTMTSPSPNLVITFNTGDPWRFTPNTWILVAATQLWPRTINSFKPPYQARGARLSTIFSPFTITLSTPSTRTERVFWSIVVVTGDGRTSTPDRGRLIVA